MKQTLDRLPYILSLVTPCFISQYQRSLCVRNLRTLLCLCFPFQCLCLSCLWPLHLRGPITISLSIEEQYLQSSGLTQGKKSWQISSSVSVPLLAFSVLHFPCYPLTFSIIKSIHSSPSHCEGLDFTVYLLQHSKSLSLKNPIINNKPRYSRYAQFSVSRISFEKYNSLPTIWTFASLLLTVKASTVNLKSPLIGSISIISAWSSFMFFLPVPNTLQIHSHGHSLDLYLNDLESSFKTLIV